MSNIYFVAIFLFFAGAAQAKPVCSFGSTFLKAGKGNACLQALVNNIKNPKDRARAQKIAKRWNPGKKLTIQGISGGYQMFRGSKLISQAGWVRQNPPTLYWNGKIKSIRKPLGSMSETIDALIAAPKTAWQINLSLLPRAEAATADEAVSEDFLVLFSLYYSERTPKQTSDDFSPFTAGQFFPVAEGLGQDWLWGRTFTCGPIGVTDLKYKYKYNAFDPEREVSLTPIKPDQYIVSGALTGGKKVKVTYTPAVGIDVCGQFGGRSDNTEICDPVWKKLLESDIRFGSAIAKNGIQVLSCREFEGEIQKKCVNHFAEFHSNIKDYGKPEFDGPEARQNMIFELCQNEDCSKTTKLTDSTQELGSMILTPQEIAEHKRNIVENRHRRVEGYIAVLRSLNIPQAESYCRESVCRRPDGMAAFDRPTKDKIEEALQGMGPVPEMDFNLEKLFLFDRLSQSVAGATMLGECCKSEPCREAVKSHDVNLTPHDPNAVQ